MWATSESLLGLVLSAVGLRSLAKCSRLALVFCSSNIANSLSKCLFKKTALRLQAALQEGHDSLRLRHSSRQVRQNEWPHGVEPQSLINSKQIGHVNSSNIGLPWPNDAKVSQSSAKSNQ